MGEQSLKLKNVIILSVILITLISLTRFHSYLLFHTIAEFFSILVAFGVFILVWNTRQHLESGSFIILGVGFMVIGAFDLLHTMAYKGMGIFDSEDANLPTQLWVIARSIETGMFLVFPIFLQRRVRELPVVIIFSAITASFILVLFVWPVFPVCYIEDSGLTPFKKVSEYLNAGIRCLAIWLWWRERSSLDRHVFLLMIIAMALTVASEVLFSLYFSVFGVVNAAGHYIKIIAYFFIYKAILELGFSKPFELLFRNVKHEEERFRFIFENAAVAIWEADYSWIMKRVEQMKAEGVTNFEEFFSNDEKQIALFRESIRIADVNSLTLELLETDTKEPLLSSFDVLPEHQARDLFPREIQALADGDRHFQSETVIETKTGSMKPVLLYITFPKIREKFDRVLISMVDITEAKRIETMLKEAKQEADAANIAKSIFLANMSHELRTPLNSIMGFTQLLEMDAADLKEEHRRYLSIIGNSGQHLLDMVNDILDLSKIEAGKIEIDKKPFILAELLKRIPAHLRALADKKNIRIEVDVQDDLGILTADETRLKQVLYNLLSNAVKFTEPDRRVGIRAWRAEENAVIEIWDEGIGIKEENLKRIFEPFEQVGYSHLERPKGTGLGLAISKRLVDLHNGSLSVKSSAGEGSVFSLVIPGLHPLKLIQSRQQNTTREDIDRMKHFRGSVLLVEDNNINARMITTLLNRLNIHTDHAETGAAGYHLATTGSYRCILMDINLPDTDGSSIMKTIRHDLENPPPIIALTAYAMHGDREKYLEEGFEDYISKPVRMEELISVLDAVFTR